MGYYVRAFCKAQQPPPLATALAALESDGIKLSAVAAETPTALADPNWTEASLLYKPDKQPLVVECNRHDGTEECLAAREIEEFLERIGPPGRSREKQQVVDHLRATR